MSTKRISELPLMEEVTENLNILVEDDGETKRIPASSVGGGSNMVEKVVLEGDGAPFVNQGNGFLTTIPEDITFNSGKEYTVVWDGETYKCVANEMETEDSTMCYIGNISIADPSLEDTGEPFVAATVDGQPGIILTTSNANSHSVKITTMVEKSSGGMMRVNITTNDDDTYSADKTYAEIAEAITSGIIPYCVYGTYVLSLYASSAISEVATFKADSRAHKFSALDPFSMKMAVFGINEHGNMQFEELEFTLTL